MTRDEIVYRLPLSIPISTFWEKLDAARRAQSHILPLRCQDGSSFRFVINKTIEEQCDLTAEFARRDLLLLCECGLLTRSVEGKKAVFTINRGL